ncbi:hypothetical protein BDW74DRAFT_187817 [Aspergillus multicolor]|uniref:fungal specific transcription factor domain-containing protein n=1 Tax=Aspergillus multicolor TaxID=41759 RepID=UPI003CCD018B
MHRRIDHLEDTVRRLIGNAPTDPPTAIPSSNCVGHFPGPTDVNSQCSARVGTTVIDGKHSVYEPTNDWHEVLREVNELKRAWGETQDDSASPHLLSSSVDGTGLLFGHVQRVDIPEILSSLPSQHELEKLIQWFLNRSIFPLSIPPIIHEPTFMREACSVIWIGLLFSVLGCTMLAAVLYGSRDYHDPEERFHLYRLRTAQCLFIGDTAKCQPYTIETLRLNAAAELNRKDDSGRGLWIVTGVIVRAAVNMGYHRDTDHTPSLSPMKGEYRRRIWLSYKIMDDVASFLSGFPRMTPAINTDTKEPLNLYDRELSDNLTVLPESRPLSEPTPATFIIAKGRLSHAFGQVVDFINGPCPDNYTKELEIDEYLNNMWSLIPLHMKVDSDSPHEFSLESPQNYSRLALAPMFHYGICTLHRRFIRTNLKKYAGDQLLPPVWYTLARSRQVLAPAAMTILLELEMRRTTPDMSSEIATDTLMEALKKSVTLWKKASEACDEAAKVYNTLNHMIQGF